MRRLATTLLTLLMLLPASLVHASQPASVAFQATPPALAALQSPLPGQALQGSIAITGNTDVPGFQSALISFAYASDSTGTWFLIQASSLPVQNGLLAQWDTTSLTDGDYNLRLLVTLADGSQVQLLASGLRVRNYSPVETDTPTPPPPSTTPNPADVTPLPTQTLTPFPSLTPIPPTPTPLPTNRAELSTHTLVKTLQTGVVAALALLVILGVYVSARGFFDRRS